MNLRLKQISSAGLMKLPDGEYNLAGNVVLVSGRNSQGKSTLLQIIEWAMGAKVGAGLGKLIRHGEEGATVKAEYLSDNGQSYWLHIEVKRKDDAENAKIWIQTQEGAKITQAKEIRAFLRTPADVAVDIMEVAQNQETATGRKKNLALLTPLLGIDVSAETQELADMKAGLTTQSKEIRQIEGMFATHGITPEEALATVSPKDAAALEQELSELRKTQSTFEAATQFIQESDRSLAERDGHIAAAEQACLTYQEREKSTLEARLAVLKAEVDAIETKLAAGIEVPGHLRATVDAHKEAKANIQAAVLRAMDVIEKGDASEAIAAKVAEITEIGAFNARVALMGTMREKASELFSLRTDATRMQQWITEKNKQISDAIAAAAAAAKIPDKFSFEPGQDGVEIFFNDPENGAKVPFDRQQVATSQMILGSLALTIAYHNANQSAPKFLTIKDASLLDSRTMKECVELAAKSGFDLYAEIVAETDGVNVEVLQ